MNPYIALAKKTIEDYLTKKKLPDIKTANKDLLNKKAGCFVSLHTKDTKELRGCIGTIQPAYKNLAGEIIGNAVAACHDPRFEPLKKKEIENIEVKVDVLAKPELISSKAELDPKKFGVVIQSNDGRSGVLLPDLEGVDSVEKQIEIAKQKAGIEKDEDVSIFRFTVERFIES